MSRSCILLYSIVPSFLPPAHKKLKCGFENHRQHNNDKHHHGPASDAIGGLDNQAGNDASQNNANQKYA
jgi:hypothetical protein